MERLKIAIQKSGRLNDDSLKILKECGISISNGLDQLRSTVSNFPMEILYLRNSDIPQYLIDGVVTLTNRAAAAYAKRSSFTDGTFDKGSGTGSRNGI